jgi:hypothetical protein
MKFETKYRICLFRAWFSQGDGLISYVKYLIAFFGLLSRDGFITITFACIYAVSALVLGKTWFDRGFVKAEIEVNNRYNKFVEEMRKNYKKENRHQ